MAQPFLAQDLHHLAAPRLRISLAGGRAPGDDQVAGHAPLPGLHPGQMREAHPVTVAGHHRRQPAQGQAGRLAGLAQPLPGRGPCLLTRLAWRDPPGHHEPPASAALPPVALATLGDSRV